MRNLSGAVAVSLLLGTPSVHAQAEKSPNAKDNDSSFYAGKVISVIVPAGPGGVYGLYLSFVSPYMSRNIPGNPSIVPQYMPGAGGTTASNYLANVAAKDGTVLAMPHSSSIMTQALKPKGVQYDIRKIQWIGTFGGSANLFAIWHTAGVKSMEDAKRTQVVIGSTGVGSYLDMTPKLLNEIVGTKFKIVSGYKGIADLDIAMERGEIQGRGGNWLSWKIEKAAWLREGKVVPLVQVTHRKAAELPDVPLLVEMARTEEEAQMFRFVSSIGPIGRSLAGPEGMPKERLAILRQAFEKTVKDPAFLKEAAEKQIEIDPTSGPDVEAEVARTLATPQSVVEKMRMLLSK